MTYLTDHRKTDEPMTREYASDIVGKLATRAYDEKISFTDVLLGDDEITSRLSEDTIRQITNPLDYLGQSREVMETVFEKYHGKKALQE
jgi:adenylosuccinate lyase